MRRALAAVAVVLPFLAGAAALPDRDPGERSFRLDDERIVESSGLAWSDGLALTVNDSGDQGRVFAVDPASGRTVGVTSWAETPRDLEALAPAGGGEVWVADIGDNLAARDDLALLRVPVGPGDRVVDPVRYRLDYGPRGPRDAESLLTHPRTGRVFVVSKGVFAGELYAAPRTLRTDRSNRLRPRGRMLAMATDGAFFPDGRHLIVRSYTRAVVYAFPSLETVAELPLPAQEQGEGIAVAPGGQVHLSSEGRRQWVLRLPLPQDVRDLVVPSPETPPAETGPAETESPEPAESETPEAAPAEAAPGGPEDEDAPEDPWRGLLDRDAWPLWAAGGLALVGAALWAARRRRG